MAAARSAADALRSVGVPVVFAGVDHYSKREVEDVLALSRLALKPGDSCLVKHCLGALRSAAVPDIAMLEAAVQTGRQPPSIPSTVGADDYVTDRIARSLEGHPGRHSRFLLGEPQELAELVKELRFAVFPAQSKRQKTKRVQGPATKHGAVSDKALRAGLLLNGVAFAEEGVLVWPAPRVACRCRHPKKLVSKDGDAPVPLCLRCGGIRSLLKGVAGRVDDVALSQSSCCAYCSGPLRDGDPCCEACGCGYHVQSGVNCQGLPRGRAPIAADLLGHASKQPWLCAGCYASYARAWWSQKQSLGDFSAPRSQTARGVMQRMSSDSQLLGMPHGSLWDLCLALSELKSSTEWLDPAVWKGIRRFVRSVGSLSTRLAELRLPEFLGRVFALLPKSRRYRGIGSKVSNGCGRGGLEEAMKAEAEAYLRKASAAFGLNERDDSAAALLRPFLEHLDLGDDLGPFAATAAGSGTAEAGRGRDAVTVATAHASKGRQWHSVLAIRFNDGLGFPLAGPSAPTTAAKAHLQEEQRLAYVATSRARQSLTVSYSLEVQGGLPASRSRFLEGASDDVKVIGIEFVNVAERQQLMAAAGTSGAAAVRGSSSWQAFLTNPVKPAADMRLKRRLFPRSGGWREAKRHRTTAGAQSGAVTSTSQRNSSSTSGSSWQ
eukprot:TRINITY_DN109285_c0_g1_i1.p1 TRINITY_DN109285_c0_g1~~TRINITY_DN109285_c0_g1_i1.p1  ORF type:complete len:696 (+),score=130.33 TRINITY_DN109285_c0_g1_i1:105-2090(+)